MQRFFPPYVVFLAAHVLFIGAALTVAALN